MASDDDGDEGRVLAEQQRGFACLALGSEWDVRGALSGGYQQGALEVVRRDGVRGVFKPAHHGDTGLALAAKASTIATAIERGWPAAAWISWGELDGRPWFVQAFALGRPLDFLGGAVEQRVLDAVRHQASIGGLPPFDWSLHTERVASPGSYWHRRCRDFGGSARALAEAIAAAHAAAIGAATPLSTDLVHGDLGTDNILEHNGEITIIDTQAIGRGSRAVDLTAMAAHCLAWDQGTGAALRFFDAAVDIVGAIAARFAGGRALGALVFSMDHYPGFVETMATRLLAMASFPRWP